LARLRERDQAQSCAPSRLVGADRERFAAVPA
jgi:hypothetical protein